MKQAINWQKINSVAEKNPDHVFHWKVNGNYNEGTFEGLIKVNRNENISEVIGFMEDYTAIIEKEKNIKTEVLFDAYSRIDIASLTCMLNDNYTKGFDDNCADLKCSDYIDINADVYEPKDIQIILKAFCDEALNRYLESYETWINEDGDEPVGEFFHNGILVKIDKSGVEISYIPLSVYVTNDLE